MKPNKKTIPFTREAYQEALDWLFVQMPNYQQDGSSAYKPGLDNIRRLCEFFGNPQQKIKTIHIGGTNGKGSTSNMLASVLQQQGYKTGLYTSPHLIEFTERIKVNGVHCDEAFVFGFIQKLKMLPPDIRPSFFEFTTIMAFEYFYQQQVDIAVIEVGLGGRLDATNILTPLVCGITNVDYDHQDLLGETLEQIAMEKAGIIKTGIPVVWGEEREAIKELFRGKAKAEGASFRDATALHAAFQTDLQGDYQRKNIRVVLGILEELKNQGMEISEAALQQGLLNVQRNTGFIGRWTQISVDPLVICDTAHNQAGLEMVFRQLQTISKTKHIVLGFVKDKKIEEVMRFLPRDAHYYFVKPAVNRGRHPQDYENMLRQTFLNYKIFDSVDAGFQAAKKNSTPEDLIFIGGSNFVVGEFLEKNLEN